MSDAPDTSTQTALAVPDRGEVAMLVREMARAHGSYVAYFQEHYKVPREEAIRRARETVWTDEEKLRRLDEQPADQVSWHDLNDAMEIAPDQALARWETIKAEARDELDSGARGAEVVRHDSPWERAQYLAVRSGFVDEWKPRGSLELSLIDQLAQTYTQWMGWLHHFDLLAASEIKAQRKDIDQYGRYEPVRLSRAESEERSLRTADRFQRMFMRSLRALRDLRRYSPQVTIHNRGQVNIGEQQVNVSPSVSGDPSAHPRP